MSLNYYSLNYSLKQVPFLAAAKKEIESYWNTEEVSTIQKHNIFTSLCIHRSTARTKTVFQIR